MTNKVIGWVRFVMLLLFVAGCATNPPVVEYTIARTALTAAKNASASRYAPGYWHQAEQAYMKGKELYKKENFSLAASHFQKAIYYAEKSENIARVEQLKAGEIQ